MLRISNYRRSLVGLEAATKFTDQNGEYVAGLPGGAGCSCELVVKKRWRSSLSGLLISEEKFLLRLAFKIQHALRHALEMTQAVLETAEVQPK